MLVTDTSNKNLIRKCSFITALNRQQSVYLTAFLVIYAMCISALHNQLPDYTGLAAIEKERFAKTLWLALTLILNLVVGLVFINIISKLTVSLASTMEVNARTGLYDEENLMAFAEKVSLKLRANKQDNQLMSFIIIEPPFATSATKHQRYGDIDQMTIILQRIMQCSRKSILMRYIK